MKNQKIAFHNIKDGLDGRLTIIEKIIPFDIKRIYFIEELGMGSLRGFHAHKELSQVIFCLSGSFDLEIYDGYSNQIIKIGKEGYLIEPKIWHMMRNFSNDCLICVLASDIYKESDYIRSFHEFKQLIK